MFHARDDNYHPNTFVHNSDMSWLTKPLAGLLIDITGVLYESGAGGGSAIPGSCSAIER